MRGGSAVCKDSRRVFKAASASGTDADGVSDLGVLPNHNVFRQH